MEDNKDNCIAAVIGLGNMGQHHAKAYTKFPEDMSRYREM